MKRLYEMSNANTSSTLPRSPHPAVEAPTGGEWANNFEHFADTMMVAGAARVG